MLDYYSVLGVEPTATQKEIHKAYIKKANKYHPDKNNNSEASNVLFRQVEEAYSCLSDSNKKADYDVEFLRYKSPPLPVQSQGISSNSKFNWFALGAIAVSIINGFRGK